jgi:glycosyltransferase involved in cell wall biosynthesis
VTAIIVAAHNEEDVIGRCIDTLQRDAAGGEFELIVVANGCTDGTVTEAERRDVRVIDLPSSGKARALNAGDAAASSFPRLYLDADIALSADNVRTLSETLDKYPNFLACAPRRAIDLRRRPLLVRAYFSVQERLPIHENALVGRGAVMVSRAGHARFTEFPDETADDLFLDAIFAPAERKIVDSVTCLVGVPYTTKDLLRRLIRVRRGNIQLRQAELTGPLSDRSDLQVRRSDSWSWLRDVVLRDPTLAPAGVVYVVLTLIAELQARRTVDRQSWGRDESTRRRAAEDAEPKLACRNPGRGEQEPSQDDQRNPRAPIEDETTTSPT